MANRVVTFGEIMMRLSPPGLLRFGQARSFDVVYGGGEANVAVSLANLGCAVDYLTRLPDNYLGDACIQFLRQYGVGVNQILRGGDRLGIYFLEMGAVQRAGKVIYDRAHSSFATIEPGTIDWQAVFSDADWFHWRHNASGLGWCSSHLSRSRQNSASNGTDHLLRSQLSKKAVEVGKAT